jgi:hypothetical protein
MLWFPAVCFRYGLGDRPGDNWFVYLFLLFGFWLCNSRLTSGCVVQRWRRVQFGRRSFQRPWARARPRRWRRSARRAPWAVPVNRKKLQRHMCSWLQRIRPTSPSKRFTLTVLCVASCSQTELQCILSLYTFQIAIFSFFWGWLSWC